MSPRSLPLLAVLLAAGCAAWRLWSEVPVPAPKSVEVPQATPERRAAALFYSDLGPDSVDVSDYPPEIARHTTVRGSLDAIRWRSINSPMRPRLVGSTRACVRAHFHGRPLSKRTFARARLPSTTQHTQGRRAGVR